MPDLHSESSGSRAAADHFRAPETWARGAFPGLVSTLAIVAAAALNTGAFAQTARDIRGASPFEDSLDNQPPPRLIVDPPFEAGLALGVFQAQYRVENLRIVPVFGPAGLNVRPRIGHLHVIVDDGPWWWADASDSNTVDVANLPPGPHKVTIQLVDPNHNVFPGQVRTLKFTVPPRVGMTNEHQASPGAPR